MPDKAIDYAFRLTCQICGTDEMDFLESLSQAVEAGWIEIRYQEYPAIPGRPPWGTHLGLCPRCQGL